MAAWLIPASAARGYADDTTGPDFLFFDVSAEIAALTAGTAGSEGSQALLRNPAGVAEAFRPAFAFTHAAALADTAFEQLEGVFPGGAGGNWAARVLYGRTYRLYEYDDTGKEIGTVNNYDLLLHLGYAGMPVSGLAMGWL